MPISNFVNCAESSCVGRHRYAGSKGCFNGFPYSHDGTFRLVAAGATDVGNIAFPVSDPSKTLDQARGAAIADVRRKAEVYAQASSLHLRRVEWSREDGGFAPPGPRGEEGASKSTLICRISARRFPPIFGRPPRERDFQRQCLFVPRTPSDQSASAFLFVRWHPSSCMLISQ